MFDFVRRHNRLLQLALALLIFPSFVLFGIQGYNRFQEGSNDEVAKVAGRPITRAELDAAHRQQVERMRQQAPNMDVKLFDTPEMKARVLEQLVRERVLIEASGKLHLAPSDDRVVRVFQSDPQFAPLRNADGTPKKELLAIRGMDANQLVYQIKQDLAMQQVLGGLGVSTPAAKAVASTALDAMFQRREVQVARFEPKNYLNQTATDAELEAYYADAKNGAVFMTPEVAGVEYLVLDLETVAKGVSVPADDLRKFYDENVSRWSQPEERHARHILIKTAAADAPDAKASNEKAKAQAEAILAELKKNRAAFPELARKQSQDPGSAARGGELDWFAKDGSMAAPFESSVFSLKKGELSALVSSEYGFHIIELLDVRGGDKRSFDSVKPEIETEVKKQLAAKRFAEEAEKFTDAVDQEDTLGAVAAKFKLELKKAEGVQRTPAPGATGALANAKLLEAIFNADNLAKKRNVQAVDIGANQLASARVTTYAPARKLPLAEVKEQVRAAVVAGKAADAARADGEAKLALWKGDGGTPGASLTPAMVIARNKAENLPRPLVDAILRAKTDKLPTWVGQSLGKDGYAVALIQKVLPADTSVLGGNPDQLRQQYAQLWANAETFAYLGSLRERYKAKVTGNLGSAADAASAAQ